MLVLTRKVGEGITIGKRGEIIVVVVAIRDNQVRLGIKAPPEVPIHREEVAERIARGETKAKAARRPRPPRLLTN